MKSIKLFLLFVTAVLIGCSKKEIKFSEIQNVNGELLYNNKKFTGKIVDRWDSGIVKELRIVEVGKLKKLEEFNINGEPNIIVNYNIKNGDIISFEHEIRKKGEQYIGKKIDFIDGKPDMKYRFKKFVDYWRGERNSVIMGEGTAVVGTLQGSANFQFFKGECGVGVNYSVLTYWNNRSASEYGYLDDLTLLKGYPFRDETKANLYEDYYIYSQWEPEKSGGGSFYVLFGNNNSKKKFMDFYILGNGNFQYQSTLELDDKEYSDMIDIFTGNNFLLYQKYLIYNSKNNIDTAINENSTNNNSNNLNTGVINGTDVIIRNSHSSNSQIIGSFKNSGETVEIIDEFIPESNSEQILVEDILVYSNNEPINLLKGKAVLVLSENNGISKVTFKDKDLNKHNVNINSKYLEKLLNNKWFKVKRKNGEIGWVYGKFIEINEIVKFENNKESLKSKPNLDELLDIDSEVKLIELFGEDNIERGVGCCAEGECLCVATILFPNTEKEVRFVWKDRVNYSELDYIRISKEPTWDENRIPQMELGYWNTVDGIHLGMGINELEEINNMPFYFYGGEWDYAYIITNWNNGLLENRDFRIRLGAFDESEVDMNFNSLKGRENYAAITGEQLVKSNLDLIKKMRPKVVDIILWKKNN